MCVLPPSEYYGIDRVKGGETKTVAHFSARGDLWSRHWRARQTDLPRIEATFQAMIRHGE